MSAKREIIRRSFWLPSALFMALAIGLGYLVPEVDAAVFLDFGFFGFADVESARTILSTIATTTVSVAGLAFSVTLVALTLSSQLLTPRVLRTFRGDRLSQFTLAALLGTFVYALLGLARLKSAGQDRVPEITVAVGLVFALLAFAMFVAFIGHIIVSLQPATVIRRIAADGHRAVAHRHPEEIGDAPADMAAVRRRIEEITSTFSSTTVRAPRAGFLQHVSGETLMSAARRCDALVVQRIPVGDFVLTGQAVAQVYAPDPDRAAEAVHGAFRLGDQRTIDQDIAFPLRQLADVALRGLSPSLNDPTTAENAMDSLADTLVRFARDDRVPPVRVDGDGEPRFVATTPNLDDLVRLGFEQARQMLDDMPMFAARMVALLEEIDRVAAEHDQARDELQRQLRLHRELAEFPS